MKGEGGKGMEEAMAATKEELLKEIKALKQAQPPPPASPPPPVTPPPPQSPMSGGGGRGGGGDELRGRLGEYQLKRFASFSEFPSLLSRFEHEEGELVRRARGLSEAMEGVVVGEEEGEGWMRGVEERGYEEEEREVREDVERLMEGFVDPTLEQRWHDVVEWERQITQRKKERASSEKERERQNQAQQLQPQAQAQAQAQAQVQAQAYAHPTPTPASAFLQPYVPPPVNLTQPPQQPFSLPPQSLGYPPLQPLPQPQSLTQLLQTSPAVPLQSLPQSHQPPAPQPIVPSPFTTDVDGLLRRQQEQANVVEELRRKLHPNLTLALPTLPADEGRDDSLSSPSDPTSLAPATLRRDAVTAAGQRSLVPLAQQEMSDEEEEEEEGGRDSPLPPPPTTHHTLPPPPTQGKGGGDEVEAIDFDEQPLTPAAAGEEKEEKREERGVGGGLEKPTSAAAKLLSPIRRVGGGYTMTASQRGPALPALSRPTQPVAAAAEAPAANFTRPTAGFFNDSQELELEEEDF